MLGMERMSLTKIAYSRKDAAYKGDQNQGEYPHIDESYVGR